MPTSSLFRSLPLSDDLSSFPCLTSTFPFCRSHYSVSSSHSLTFFFSLSLALISRLAPDYLASSSSSRAFVVQAPGSARCTISLYSARRRLLPPTLRRRLRLRTVLVRSAVQRRDYRASVSLFFSLFPFRPRARGLPDNFRLSAQWLGTATAQPALRTRISTCDQRWPATRPVTREPHATAMRSARKMTGWWKNWKGKSCIMFFAFSCSIPSFLPSFFSSL